MRFSFGVVACGFGLISLVACSGEGEGRLLGDDPARANGGNPSGGTGATNPADDPPPASCDVAIPQPTMIGADGTATDVHLTKRGVIFRVGPTVVQVGRDGKNRRELYTSPNIVRSWVDDASIVLVESVPETDTSVIRVLTIDNLPDPTDPNKQPGLLDGGVAVPTGLNPGAIEIFSSDLSGFYMLAEAAGNETLYRVEKANPAAMTPLATSDKEIITNPLLANGYVWYVRGGQRVFKVGAAQPIEGTPNDNGEIPLLPGAPPGPPQEVFGISYANFRLAVDAKYAFYTTGKALEKRDLTGANPGTVLEAEKSKSKASFGTPIADADSVILPSTSPDPLLKHVIRSVKVTATGSEEKLAACGRDVQASSVVVDKTSIAWVEGGKGVFVAPR